MHFFDHYLVFAFIFSPLIATVFLALTPINDTNSKDILSKFFAAIIALLYSRIILLFFAGKLVKTNIFTLNIINFTINLTAELNKKNIILFGFSSIVLAIFIFINNNRDAKTNIHHILPFMLIFILFICLGQKDLRIAIPILSIANFLIFYTMSQSNGSRRGTSIFQMGIFLLICDIISLVAIQYIFVLNSSLSYIKFAGIAALLPGLSRLLLPLCAPFNRRFFSNLDEADSPIIIIFFQLSGFAIITLFSEQNIALINTMRNPLLTLSLVSSFLVAINALSENKIIKFPYYFISFYSSFTVALVFGISDKLWYISFSLLLASITCFFYLSRLAEFVSRHNQTPSRSSLISVLWTIAIAFMIGVPGIGIGTALWHGMYTLFLPLQDATKNSSFDSLFPLACLCSLLIFSYAAVKSVSELSSETVSTALRRSPRISLSAKFLPIFMALIANLIPVLVTYVALVPL
jgi:hypothetical protein